jgi:hypothetical protein
MHCNPKGLGITLSPRFAVQYKQFYKNPVRLKVKFSIKIMKRLHWPLQSCLDGHYKSSSFVKPEISDIFEKCNCMQEISPKDGQVNLSLCKG